MASDDSSKEVPKKVVAHALSLAFGTLCSRILGLTRDIVVAALFPRAITDAWSAAFRLPNLFRRLLGEGALAVSFIPVYVHARLDSPERARNLANGFYTLLLVFLAAFTAVGILAARPLMDFLLDPSFAPAARELTLRMTQIMFGFIFLITTFAYFMGILNALGSFAWAALAPTLFNIVMIAFAVIPQERFAMPGDGLAWGVLVGGFVQVAVLVPLLQRRGVLPRMRWPWGARTGAGDVSARRVFREDLHRVLANVLPGLLGMGLLQLIALVNLRYASGLGEGAISYIYWADRLLELPLSLVSVSLGSALLPTLSQLWSSNLPAKMSETANYYLRLNLFIAIPAGLGLYFLARPIVEVLFMRGEFSAADAAGTISVLQVYGFLLIAASAVRVLVPSYYAAKDVWYPAWVTLACVVVHLLIAPRFAEVGGLSSLMMSSLVSVSLAAGLLLVGYAQRIASFDFWRLLRHSGKFVLAGAGMSLVVQMYEPLIEFFGNARGVHGLVLAATICAGAAAYGGCAWLLGAEELGAFMGRGE